MVKWQLNKWPKNPVEDTMNIVVKAFSEAIMIQRENAIMDFIHSFVPEMFWRDIEVLKSLGIKMAFTSYDRQKFFVMRFDEIISEHKTITYDEFMGR